MAWRKGEKTIKKNGRTNVYTPLLAEHTWKSSAIHLPRYLYHCVGGRTSVHTYLLPGPRRSRVFRSYLPIGRKSHTRSCARTILYYCVRPSRIRLSRLCPYRVVFQKQNIFHVTPSCPKPIACNQVSGGRRNNLTFFTASAPALHYV